MESGNFPLQFTIEILSAHFSSPGQYFLVLRIVGSKVKPSTIKLYVGNSQNALDRHEFTTDACLEDGDPETFATFNDSLISFWMPAGSADGDIQLVLEAFRLAENPTLEEVKYGEAVFEVFPRKARFFSNIRQKTPSSDDSNEVYQFETNIKFTQILEEEGFSTNCGLVRATVKLDQIKEPKTEAREVAWNFLQQQQRAGSLANLCPNFDVDYRLSTEYLSHDRVDIEEEEEEEVIAVWDNKEGNFAKENSAHTSSRQSQTVKLACSDNELGESDLNEHDYSLSGKEIEVAFEEVKPGGSMGSDIVESGHIIESQPDDSHVHSIPLKLDEENFESLAPQELQNRSHRTYYGFREERQKNVGRRISYRNSNRGHKAATVLFSASRWERQAIKPVAEEETVAEPVAEAETVAEPVAVAKTVAEPVAVAKTVAEPIAEAKTVENPQPIKPLLLPVPGDPGPGPSSVTEVSVTNKIQESALGNNVESIPIHHLCGSYLARAGYCEVAILAHGAIGLPLNSDNRLPQPYIVGKSGKSEARGLMGQSVTHAAVHPTQSPCWEELLLVEIKEEEAKNEVVILLIADHPSKELLTEYKVPLEHIKPFQQYHLELVQPNSELHSDTRLYVTLMKKMDKLPLLSLGSRVYGLELLLRNFEQQIHGQMGPLIATLRIVSDWEEYRETMLSPQPRPTGVSVTTIHFPSPHPTSFAVAGATLPHGAPQVTTAGRPQEQPQWNQTLLFLGDESSLFTAKSACVVEYYPAVLAMTRDSWQLTSPIGYSYQSLDQLLLSSLQCDEAKLGLKLYNIPVEGSKLRTVTRTCPTIGLVARLITEERPEPYLISATHLASLPTFRAKAQADQLRQLSYVDQADLTTYRQTSRGLPPMDAVRSILPHFHSLYTEPRTEPVQEYVPLIVSSPAVRGTPDTSDGTPNPTQVRGNIDDKNLAVMDYQMKEVDRYRTAMRKMATDLLHVREDCKRLEEENSRFRRDLTQHEEISRLMVSSKDLDHVTHSELVQKFVLLKKKLADESSKKQELQNRLHYLQNDLIKKNDTEKEYVKLQEAHEGQQALLQKLQVKVQKTKAIQDTCKKQEKVIVQLEKLLAQQRAGQFNGVAETSDTYRFLSEENTKLQSEVSQYKEMLRQAEAEAKQKLARSSDKHITSDEPMSDMERLELYEKLERAEGRIAALEKQLADNVRKWAKDKADLQMKLSERMTAQKTGFKTSTSASMDILDWHNGPKPSSPSRHLGPRRPSPKLEPLERR